MIVFVPPATFLDRSHWDIPLIAKSRLAWCAQKVTFIENVAYNDIGWGGGGMQRSVIVQVSETVVTKIVDRLVF